MNNSRELAFNDTNLGQSWVNYWINQLEEVKTTKRTQLDFGKKMAFRAISISKKS